MMVPISLAARSPHALPDSIFDILVSDVSTLDAPTAGLPTPPVSDSSLNPKAPAFPPPPGDTAMSSDSDEDKDEGEGDESLDDSQSPERRELAAEEAMDQILRFVTGLRHRRILSKAESDALEELLFEDSSLIFAAYSVALSANDAEYFAEICRDLSNSLQSEAGRLACEAQVEVLRLCDGLYLDEKISDNQLLFLRHLVLIRDEAVATAYDDFQMNQSPEWLSRCLFRMAFKQPPEAGRAGSDMESDIEGSQEESSTAAVKMSRYQSGSLPNGDSTDSRTETTSQDDGDIDNAIGPTAIVETRLSLLVSSLLRQSRISAPEASLLLDLIAQGNEYVFAAWELYESDSNLGELEDTLLRCVRLESRKRSAIMQENAIEVRRQQQLEASESALSSAAQMASGESESEESESSGDSEDSESSDEDSDVYQGEDEEASPRIGSDSIGEMEPFLMTHFGSIAALLDSLGVANSWANEVPEGFIAVVFSSARNGLLDTNKARALCDLFQAGYDLVRAAWEVFCVQANQRDLVDTLQRIVRDLDLSPLQLGEGESGSASAQVDTQESESESEAESQSESEAEEQSPSARAIPSGPVVAARKQALVAVTSAKRELLRHSLEMMVKQGMTTSTNAASLLARADGGDRFVDAAIEAYATDKDVAEFLETLSILANHSAEDLEALLRSSDGDMRESGSKTETAAEKAKEEEKGETEEDGDGDEDEDGALKPAQIDMLAMVAQLWQRKLIDEALKIVLVKLISVEDARLTEAHWIYQQTRDEVVFAESIARVAKSTFDHIMQTRDVQSSGSDSGSQAQQDEELGIEMANVHPKQPEPEPGIEMRNYSSSAAERREKSEENDREEGSSDDADDTSDEGDDSESLLNRGDKLAIIDILSKSGAVEPEQTTLLRALINAGESTLDNVFLLYETSKDVYALISHLRDFTASQQAKDAGVGEVDGIENDADSYQNSVNGLDSPLTEEGKGTDAAAAEDEDADKYEYKDDYESDSEEEDAENSGENDFDEDDCQTIEMRFLNIVQNMSLSKLETAALRLAISRSDPKIRAALESFRSSRDDSELKKSLHNIARRTIDTTLAEAGYELAEDDEVGDEEGDNNADGVNDDNEDDDEADNEEDTNDGDEDSPNQQPSAANAKENAGTGGGILSPKARERMFPILLMELTKQSIVPESASQQLLERFQKTDPIIFAALDVYDLDGDMAELVDTLARIAATAE
jgi:hypothetical protein